MNVQELYQQKLTTADEAVKVVKSGDWVDYGWCTGTPVALDKALAARMGELEDVNFRGGVLMRRPAVFDIPNAADKRQKIWQRRKRNLLCLTALTALPPCVPALPARQHGGD